ncbi:MAG TPA: response regulator transcription factor [Flavihumibacter sp.]|jgi:two-component system OmpR family response regulator
MHILLIEDDQTLNQNITDALQAEGMQVTALYDGALAEKALKRDQFDCVVMDISLPGRDGFELCRGFRQYNTNTPVIMLTAFAELDDKVRGYDSGADDYLTKPFYMRELLLRINSLIKRAHTAHTKPDTIVADDIVIDTKTKSVMRQGKSIQLTPREYQILVRLIENKGELVSKKDLIREIWGNVLEANTNTIEVYINFLRNKLEKPFNKQNIKTKVGYGYYFE